MSSKIFEEAIADAKKLREVAEDNAKKAILEAVTPKIRNFIEEQLLEGVKAGSSSSSSSSSSSDDGDDRESGDPGIEITDESSSLDEDVFLDEAALNSLVTMLGGTDILDSLMEHEAPADVIGSSITAAVSSLTNAQRKKLLEISNKINNTVDNLTSRGIKIYNGKSFELDKKLNSNFANNKFPRFDYSVQKNIIYIVDSALSVE